MYPRTTPKVPGDGTNSDANGRQSNDRAGPAASSVNDPQIHEPADTVVIGAGVRLKGEIWSCAKLVIAGDVEGAFAASEVHVLHGAKVNATIVTERADIRGAMNGKLIVADRVEIGDTGSFDGRLVYGKLSLQPGAVVTGSLSKDLEAEEQEAVNGLPGRQAAATKQIHAMGLPPSPSNGPSNGMTPNGAVGGRADVALLSSENRQ